MTAFATSGTSRFIFIRVLRTLAIAALLVGAGPALAGSTLTILRGDPGSSTYGQTVTFTAEVDGTGPTGTVTFLDGKKVLGTGTMTTRDARSSIAAGGVHTCAVTEAGAVRCWGFNAYGQLGDGSTGDSATPVAVSGLTSGVVAIAAGSFHSCAVTEAGAVWCWGSNEYGQLGDGTNNNRTSPVAVSGLSSGVVAIAAGGSHTCALTEAGAVWCWGEGTNGQLGNGSNAASTTPVAVDVSDLSSGVAAITAGGSHACALTEAGAVWCWGYNGSGQLGDGSNDARNTPVAVNGLSAGVAAIRAGARDTCAVTASGAAKCWGYNETGQLGDGTTNDRTSPVPVGGLSSGVAAIAPGAYHTCALTENGGALCWGLNTSGELGDGSTFNRMTPDDVSGLSSGVAAIAANLTHTCALTEDGAAKCWGGNVYGQLGNGSTDDSATPAAVSGFGAGTALVAASGATFSTAALSARTHRITARYDGDDFNDKSTSSRLKHVVFKGKTKTKVKAKPKKPKSGKSVRLTITTTALSPAEGTPVGKVVIKDNGKKLSKLKVKRGIARAKLRKLTKGTHKYMAVFKASSDWKKSSAKKKVKVK